MSAGDARRLRLLTLRAATDHECHDSAPAPFPASQAEAAKPAGRSTKGKGALTRACPAQLLSGDRISGSLECPVLVLITELKHRSSRVFKFFVDGKKCYLILERRGADKTTNDNRIKMRNHFRIGKGQNDE